LSSLYPSSSLLVLDTSFSPPLPLPLKLGDVNLDGFPDIITITGSGNDRVPGLVFSVPCAKDVVGCSASGTGRRGWRVAKNGVEPLSTIKDARTVSFVDLDEDVGVCGFVACQELT
jgi:integrin alpha FG-GAP repeat containing protein 1